MSELPHPPGVRVNLIGKCSILDIYSRRVVGWQIAEAETATLFEPLFHETVAKHNVPPGQQQFSMRASRIPVGYLPSFG